MHIGNIKTLGRSKNSGVNTFYPWLSFDVDRKRNLCYHSNFVKPGLGKKQFNWRIATNDFRQKSSLFLLFQDAYF